jgi:integrase
MEIAEDKYVKKWLRERDVKKSSTEQYQRIMKKYTTYHQQTPTALIEEARKEQAEQPWLSERKINERLYDFYNHLKENKITSSKAYLTTVRSFYGHFEIQLPKMRIKNPAKEQQLSTDIPGKKEIGLALENTKQRYKAIILFMASTGLSMSDVLNLTITDFLTALNISSIDEIASLLGKKETELVGLWQGHRFKNGIPYITFNSPESTKNIIKYLLERKWVLKPDQYLFTNTWNNGNIAIRTFNNQFVAINDRCGFGKSGKHHYFTSHQLRRFFSTTLTEHRVPYLFVQWMTGHKLPSVPGAYNKPSLQALREEYLRVLPYITIREKVKVNLLTDDRLAEIEEKLLKEKKEKEDMKARLELLESLADKELDQVKKAKKDLPEPKK